jgi:hypothetical protein
MPTKSRACRVLPFTILCVLVAVSYAGGQQGQPATAKPGSSANMLVSDASKYVGAETCKTCHEEIYNGWEKTPHWKTTLNKDGGPPNRVAKAATAPARSTSPAEAIRARSSCSASIPARKPAPAV